MAGTVSAESDSGHFNYNSEILGWKPSSNIATDSLTKQSAQNVTWHTSSMQSAYNNINSVILPNLSPITDIIAIISKKLSIIAIKNFVPIMATLFKTHFTGRCSACHNSAKSLLINIILIAWGPQVKPIMN